MPSFDTEGFDKALRECAKARGKDMKQVSAETGVSETTLSRMHNHHRAPDAASLAALSAWAGINPARFSGLMLPRGWVCSKCQTDRTKAACPNGHSAALTGDCPMVGIGA